MTYAEYLNTMTVKTLTEIAKQMNLKTSGLRKAELVAKLDSQISGWHVIAGDMDRANYPKAPLHVDNITVIDTEELPMDHGQFTVWYNRHGGVESFDVNKALASDHAEALKMNENHSESVYVMNMNNGSQVEFTGKSADILIRHQKNLKRYNPEMTKDRGGKVRITARQARRLNKKLKHYAKSIGYFEGAFSTK